MPLITVLLWKPGARKRSLVFKRVLKCVRKRKRGREEEQSEKRDAERVTKTETTGIQWEESGETVRAADRQNKVLSFRRPLEKQ